MVDEATLQLLQPHPQVGSQNMAEPVNLHSVDDAYEKTQQEVSDFGGDCSEY